MSAGADPIGVIESGYDLGGSNQEWLQRVVRTLQPLLDGGHGVLAYTFDVRLPFERWFDDVALVGADVETLRDAVQVLMTHPSAAEGMHQDQHALSGANEGLRRLGFKDGVMPQQWTTYLNVHGIADVLGLRTIEPGGRGICVSAGQTYERTIDPRTRRLWAQVSAHLAAARRLRKTLSEAQEEAVAEEAILNPSGHLAHAEGLAKERHARAALQQAVLRQERARGRLRRHDPEAATEAWNALVTGRWSLIERFESDGRRYLVARPNEVHVADPRALTERERVITHLAALGKTNKLIAYELGLSLSTVATHLTAALRKLGLTSRTQLASVLMALPGQAPPSS